VLHKIVALVSVMGEAAKFETAGGVVSGGGETAT
jgi:hypothetical protein